LKKDEKFDLYNRLLITAEKEITSYIQYQIKHDYSPENNLRVQIENLIIGSKFSEEIVFYQVEFKGGSFVLRLNKDDFIGRNIKILRSFRKGNEGPYDYKDFDVQGYNYGIIKEKTQILKEAIESAMGENGRVRIYPLYKPNQIDGYQFLLRTDMWDRFIPTERHEISGTAKKDARCFDIDLQDGDLQNKLEHIVKLSISYIPPNPRSPYTKDFLFLILKDNLGDKAAYDYDKMIGAFDRHMFYNPDEIFSSGVGSVKCRPVRINSFENGIVIDSNLIKQWIRASKFIGITTDNMFPNNYRNWW